MTRERTPEERDVNAAIKQLLEITDDAARLTPDVACEPYTADARRRAVIQLVWGLYARIKKRPKEQPNGDAGQVQQP